MIHYSKQIKFFSQDAEDIVFERMTPGSPQRFDDVHHRDPFAHLRSHRSSTDHDNFIHYRDGGTPDSPISQVCLLTISIISFFKILKQTFYLFSHFFVFFFLLPNKHLFCNPPHHHNINQTPKN